MTTTRPDETTTAAVQPTAKKVTAAEVEADRRTALGRLAAKCYDGRRLVLGIWVALLIVINVLAFAEPGIFRNDFSGGNSQSQQALNFLKANFPAEAGDPSQIVFKSTTPITSAANEAQVNAVLDAVSGMRFIVSVTSPFDPKAPGQISADGKVAFATLQFDRSSSKLTKSNVKPILDKILSFSKPGFEVVAGGAPIEQAETPVLGSTEGVGIFAAIIILLFAFGSVIAMGLPIVTALFGIAVGVGVIDLFSHLTVVPTFATELAAMIGIGVGIDYALFIVTRYRQGLNDGFDPRHAVILALSTSGRSVLFAGSTVVISLLGMLLLGLPFVYGLAFGAIAAVLLVMAGSLTLLPALLGFSGHAIDRLRVPNLLHRGPTSHRESFWWRWSRLIQRVPWIAAAVSLAILVVLAIPLFSMKLAFTDAGNDQTNLSTRKAFDILAQSFGPGANGPLVIAVQLPAGGGAGVATRITAAAQSTPGIVYAAPPVVNQHGNAAIVVVIPKTSGQDARTQQLVHHLRNQVLPPITAGTGAKALVGGVTAASVDSSSQLSGRLPYVIGGVIILAFLLLMAVFRSIAVPLKAAIMNLLSVGAAYGVIVAVFQWGWLGSFFNIGATGPIDPWVPLMLFTILFGLSMDYEVFLLSRIREEWLDTGDNSTAVADGLAITARVITAAAAIMVCVFGSFVLGDIRVLKLFGLGLASAVLVDATVVRMVLVPATMELLGKATWYMPKWLDAIVPKLSVESGAAAVGERSATSPAT